jgi:hypothetical protein
MHVLDSCGAPPGRRGSRFSPADVTG